MKYSYGSIVWWGNSMVCYIYYDAKLRSQLLWICISTWYGICCSDNILYDNSTFFLFLKKLLLSFVEYVFYFIVFESFQMTHSDKDTIFYYSKCKFFRHKSVFIWT